MPASNVVTTQQVQHALEIAQAHGQSAHQFSIQHSIHRILDEGIRGNRGIYQVIYRRIAEGHMVPFLDYELLVETVMARRTSAATATARPANIIRHHDGRVVHEITTLPNGIYSNPSEEGVRHVLLHTVQRGPLAGQRVFKRPDPTGPGGWKAFAHLSLAGRPVEWESVSDHPEHEIYMRLARSTTSYMADVHLPRCLVCNGSTGIPDTCPQHTVTVTRRIAPAHVPDAQPDRVLDLSYSAIVREEIL